MKGLVVLFGIVMSCFANSTINREDLLISMVNQTSVDGVNWQLVFTMLQAKYFSVAFLVIALGIPVIFLIHYLIIGPMIFSHDRKKIFMFPLFQRLIHWLAGFSFLVLIPTGLIMTLGNYFGGGEFVRVCKELHAISTVVFAIAVGPMLIMWFKEMLPIAADIKWLKILGGYLNKRKDPIPASKFNAGQKMWFWVCTVGGIMMIMSGAAMYFSDVTNTILRSWGYVQVDLLRISAIIHNVLGMAMVALFFTHVYMSVFAIKGAIHSMFTGYKEEEEVEILHSIYYKEMNENKNKK